MWQALSSLGIEESSLVSSPVGLSGKSTGWKDGFFGAGSLASAELLDFGKMRRVNTDTGISPVTPFSSGNGLCVSG